MGATGERVRANGNTKEFTKTIGMVNSVDDMTMIQEALSREEVICVYIVIVSAVVDILGLAIVVPILPYYAEYFGADAAQLGLLFSAYSASELVGTLFMGSMSDIFGRRAIIVTSLFGSFSGYVFHGLCQDYNQLLAARIYTGFFSYAVTIAEAYIVDVVPEPLQPKYMAKLYASIGIIFMVGPTIGGGISTVTQNHYSVPYYAAAVIAGLGLVFAFIYLKNPQKRVCDIDFEASAGAEDITDEQEFVDGILKSRLCGIPTIIYVLGIIRFCAHTGFTAQVSMFGLFALEKYGISVAFLSAMLMAGYVCFFMTSVSLFEKLVVYLGLVNTLSVGILVMGTVLILYIFPGSEGNVNVWLTFIIQCFFFVGWALYVPSITSLLAKFTTPGERGKILGCGSLFMSAADIIGPIVFGWLYQQDVNLVWYAGGSAPFLSFILLRIVDAALEKKRLDRNFVDKKSPGLKPTVEENFLGKKSTHSKDVDCLVISHTHSLFCNRRDDEELLVPSQSSDSA